MTDFTPQSTDRLPVDTSKYTYREVYRGTFTIQTAAQATGYAGSTTVDLSFLDTNLFIPEIEISQDDSGGGVTAMTKLPYTSVSTSGTIRRAASYDVESDLPKGGGYTLAFAVSLYDSTSAINKTFYYKVLSSEAGPGVVGAW